MDARAPHDPDPGIAAVVLLPLVLLALDSDWIFSGPHRDAWIYYGYFENGVDYLRRFQDHYYASRPAVILPGFVLHHLLPTVTANVLLHLAVYWSALLSFYLVARDLFGRRVALLSGIALGCYPYFLRAAGWNYVDGFGIAYFLVALLLLTRAAGSRHWRLLLAGAGALATALVSSNLFYGVYLPLLAGFFLVLNRERQRIPLLSAVLWAGIGTLGTFALLGGMVQAAGGRFFYLGTSLRFLADSVGTQNPFRQPGYAWVPKAVWLVVPALALLGGAAALGRNSSLRRDRPLLWFQVQLLLLVLVTVYFQAFGDTGVLQHFYYASLLIPVAFLALAGQITPLVENLPRERFAALAAGVAVLLIVPLLMPIAGIEPRDFPLGAPTLLAGLGVVAGVGWRQGGRRALLTVFVSLALVYVLIRQGGTIFWEFERHGGDGHGLYSQVGRAVGSLDSFDPSHRVRLWYDYQAEDGIVYDAVASVFVLCPNMVNLEFPKLTSPLMCDGAPLAPGVRVAVLSADPAAFEKADAALRKVGFSARLIRREEIPGPSRGFAITYLEPEIAP
ncbi:MAG TPA: glycosyltransferase family 39 protein [Thermoanaerobaculia bacterium]|nr:glycosyltransferase family 39 protein [Thermoanaerobaculia bacterium]